MLKIISFKDIIFIHIFVMKIIDLGSFYINLQNNSSESGALSGT